MVRFRIKPIKGNSIKYAIDGAKYVTFWAVYVLNRITDNWIFLQAFYTEQRAQNFIQQLKKSIAKGDYSCLTLKT